MQHLLDIPGQVRNVVDHGVYRDIAITFVVAQLRTRADLYVPMGLPQGASSISFENLIQGCDEAAGGIAGAVSSEDLMC